MAKHESTNVHTTPPPLNTVSWTNKVVSGSGRLPSCFMFLQTPGSDLCIMSEGHFFIRYNRQSVNTAVVYQLCCELDYSHTVSVGPLFPRWSTLLSQGVSIVDVILQKTQYSLMYGFANSRAPQMCCICSICVLCIYRDLHRNDSHDVMINLPLNFTSRPVPFILSRLRRDGLWPRWGMWHEDQKSEELLPEDTSL